MKWRRHTGLVTCLLPGYQFLRSWLSALFEWRKHKLIIKLKEIEKKNQLKSRNRYFLPSPNISYNSALRLIVIEMTWWIILIVRRPCRPKIQRTMDKNVTMPLLFLLKLTCVIHSETVVLVYVMKILDLLYVLPCLSLVCYRIIFIKHNKVPSTFFLRSYFNINYSV